MKIKPLRACCYGLLLLLAVPVAADSRTPGKVIAGWVEKIRLPQHDVVLKAKLDTGAKTSSIYALNVSRYKRGKERRVSFDLVLQRKPELVTAAMDLPRSRSVLIKDHDSESDRRSAVMLDICFDGRIHSVEFTLADRGQFIYPALLGRTFLESVAVVDPSATFLTQAACGVKPGAD